MFGVMDGELVHPRAAEDRKEIDVPPEVEFESDSRLAAFWPPSLVKRSRALVL